MRELLVFDDRSVNLAKWRPVFLSYKADISYLLLPKSVNLI